jgi:drug/metabolite transporter (DMT)-like permease
MAAMCWGTYSVLARHYRLDAVRATVAVTAFGCFTWLPIYAVLLLSHAVTGHVLEASWREIVFQMLMQGGWSVVISGIAFTKMLQYYGAVRSTMITALVPGLSAMGAVLLLGEPLYWNLGAGLMMVTLGILFGVRATVVVKP